MIGGGATNLTGSTTLPSATLDDTARPNGFWRNLDNVERAKMLFVRDVMAVDVVVVVVVVVEIGIDIGGGFLNAGVSGSSLAKKAGCLLRRMQEKMTQQPNARKNTASNS